MPKPVVVAVVYHPDDPKGLEKKYPGHLEKPGVTKLVDAAQTVYAGNVVGEINGRKATRIAVFVFPSLRVWDELVGDREVQAVVVDATLISGRNGVSIVIGEVDAIKEVSMDPKAPHVIPVPEDPGIPEP